MWRSFLQGCSLLPVVQAQQAAVERTLFWEMEHQTAVRRGSWKLVLNGQLVEGAQPQDAGHLSNLADDPGEVQYLCDQYPQVTAQLQQAAVHWRSGIEQRWDREFSGGRSATVMHP